MNYDEDPFDPYRPSGSHPPSHHSNEAYSINSPRYTVNQSMSLPPREHDDDPFDVTSPSAGSSQHAMSNKYYTSNPADKYASMGRVGKERRKGPNPFALDSGDAMASTQASGSVGFTQRPTSPKASSGYTGMQSMGSSSPHMYTRSRGSAESADSSSRSGHMNAGDTGSYSREPRHERLASAGGSSTGGRSAPPNPFASLESSMGLPLPPQASKLRPGDADTDARRTVGSQRTEGLVLGIASSSSEGAEKRATGLEDFEDDTHSDREDYRYGRETSQRSGGNDGVVGGTSSGHPRELNMREERHTRTYDIPRDPADPMAEFTRRNQLLQQRQQEEREELERQYRDMMLSRHTQPDNEVCQQSDRMDDMDSKASSNSSKKKEYETRNASQDSNSEQSERPKVVAASDTDRDPFALNAFEFGLRKEPPLVTNLKPQIDDDPYDIKVNRPDEPKKFIIPSSTDEPKKFIIPSSATAQSSLSASHSASIIKSDDALNALPSTSSMASTQDMGIAITSDSQKRIQDSSDLAILGKSESPSQQSVSSTGPSTSASASSKKAEEIMRRQQELQRLEMERQAEMRKLEEERQELIRQEREERERQEAMRLERERQEQEERRRKEELARLERERLEREALRAKREQEKREREELLQKRLREKEDEMLRMHEMEQQKLKERYDMEMKRFRDEQLQTTYAESGDAQDFTTMKTTNNSKSYAHGHNTGAESASVHRDFYHGMDSGTRNGISESNRRQTKLVNQDPDLLIPSHMMQTSSGRGFDNVSNGKYDKLDGSGKSYHSDTGRTTLSSFDAFDDEGEAHHIPDYRRSDHRTTEADPFGGFEASKSSSQRRTQYQQDRRYQQQHSRSQNDQELKKSDPPARIRNFSDDSEVVGDSRYNVLSPTSLFLRDKAVARNAGVLSPGQHIQFPPKKSGDSGADRYEDMHGGSARRDEYRGSSDYRQEAEKRDSHRGSHDRVAGGRQYGSDGRRQGPQSSHRFGANANDFDNTYSRHSDAYSDTYDRAGDRNGRDSYTSYAAADTSRQTSHPARSNTNHNPNQARARQRPRDPPNKYVVRYGAREEGLPQDMHSRGKDSMAKGMDYGQHDADYAGNRAASGNPLARTQYAQKYGLYSEQAQPDVVDLMDEPLAGSGGVGKQESINLLDFGSEYGDAPTTNTVTTTSTEKEERSNAVHSSSRYADSRSGNGNGNGSSKGGPSAGVGGTDPFAGMSRRVEEDPFDPNPHPNPHPNPPQRGRNEYRDAYSDRDYDHAVKGHDRDSMHRLRQAYQLTNADQDRSYQSEDDDARDSVRQGRPPDALRLKSPDSKMEGRISARLSLTKMFTKEWKSYFWVIQQDTLLIYRFREDFIGSPSRIQLTPPKKAIPITHNLRLLKIKAKDYRGTVMYNFMLEEVMDYGPANVGKFGSESREEVDAIWSQLRTQIAMKRQEVFGGDRMYQPGLGNG